jgi:uncharacterized damage-inducible protein DinB
MTRYDFLIETYRTERLKILSVWAQVPDGRMRERAEHRARTPLEHMVHQCLSEDGWMRTMLGIDVGHDPLPAEETRDAFIAHYGECTAERIERLSHKPDEWFEEETQFFDTGRSRAWILTRRLLNSPHHRGQLNAAIRAWGQPLYSTYGPTADTGGLPKDGARTIYRFDSAEAMAGASVPAPPLPAPGASPVTERPDGPER